MSDFVIRLNGASERELGWLPMADGGPWTVPTSTVSSSRGAGLLGQVSTGLPTGQPRTTAVSLRTESGAVTERRDAMDRLIRQLDGLVEVEWGDAPGRYRLCRLEGVDARTEITESSWVDGSGHLRVELRLTEDDPVEFAYQPTILAVGTDPVRPELGTAPSAPRFVFPGPFSGLTIEYLGGSGFELAVLEFGEVESGEYLEVDCGTDVSPYVVVGDANAREVDWSVWDGGSFFSLDPGDRPSVRASEPGVMYYRQAWR